MADNAASPANAAPSNVRDDEMLMFLLLASLWLSIQLSLLKPGTSNSTPHPGPDHTFLNPGY